MKLSVALQLLLVFASGAVVGGLAYRFYTRPTQTEMRKRADGKAQFRQKIVNEMRSRLKLREDQVQKLSEIMDASDRRFAEAWKRVNREVRKRVDPEMKALQAEHVDKIRAILDASQRAEYEKMLEERAKREEQEKARKHRH
jgi:hypothetical protein